MRTTFVVLILACAIAIASLRGAVADDGPYYYPNCQQSTNFWLFVFKTSYSVECIGVPAYARYWYSANNPNGDSYSVILEDMDENAYFDSQTQKIPTEGTYTIQYDIDARSALKDLNTLEDATIYFQSEIYPVAPHAPTDVDVYPYPNEAGDPNGKLWVSWTRPLDDGGAAITSYNIILKTENGSTTYSTTSSGWWSPEIPKIGQPASALYTVEVEAVNSQGAGAASIESAPTMIASAPSTPRIVSIANVSDVAVEFSYTVDDTGGFPPSYVEVVLTPKPAGWSLPSNVMQDTCLRHVSCATCRSDSACQWYPSSSNCRNVSAGSFPGDVSTPLTPEQCEKDSISRTITLSGISTTTYGDSVQVHSLQASTQYAIEARVNTSTTNSIPSTSGFGSPFLFTTGSAICGDGCVHGTCGEPCDADVGQCTCHCLPGWGTAPWDHSCSDLTYFIATKVAQAELLYLAKNESQAIEVLQNDLLAIVNPYLGNGTLADHYKASDLVKGAQVLAANLERGLNLAGQPRDSVQLWTWSSYMNVAKDWVQALQSAQGALNQAVTAQQKSSAVVSNAASELSQSIQHIAELQKEYETDMQDLRGLSGSMLTIMDEGHMLMAKNQDLIQEAVTQINQKITTTSAALLAATDAADRDRMFDLLKDSAEVISEAISLYTGIGDLSSAYDAYRSAKGVMGIAEKLEKFQDVGKKVKSVYSSGKGLVGNIKQIYDIMTKGSEILSDNPAVKKDTELLKNLEMVDQMVPSILTYMEKGYLIFELAGMCSVDVTSSNCTSSLKEVLQDLPEYYSNGESPAQVVKKFVETVKALVQSSPQLSQFADTMQSNLDKFYQLQTQQMDQLKQWYTLAMQVQVVNTRIQSATAMHSAVSSAYNQDVSNNELATGFVEMIRHRAISYWILAGRTLDTALQQFSYQYLQNTSTFSFPQPMLSTNQFAIDNLQSLIASIEQLDLETPQQASNPCWDMPMSQVLDVYNGTAVLNIPFPNATEAPVNRRALQVYASLLNGTFAVNTTVQVEIERIGQSMFAGSRQQAWYFSVDTPSPRKVQYDAHSYCAIAGVTSASSPTTPSSSQIPIQDSPYGWWKLTFKMTPRSGGYVTSPTWTPVPNGQYLVKFQTQTSWDVSSSVDGVCGTDAPAICNDASRGATSSQHEKTSSAAKMPPFNCPNGCSGRGTCDSRNGMCSCFQGYTGAGCNISLDECKLGIAENMQDCLQMSGSFASTSSTSGSPSSSSTTVYSIVGSLVGVAAIAAVAVVSVRTRRRKHAVSRNGVPSRSSFSSHVSNPLEHIASV